ncbi:MAG: NAD-dependent epimerase/dehydratase family protein, partial [bacterium]|nr:NAD-dependent epimerase/dehydratase family protein [bacterium]
RVILASSQAVYGEGRYRCSMHGIVFPLQRPTDGLKKNAWDVLCPHHQHRLCTLTPQWTAKDDPLYPHNAYAMSKRAQEELALNLGRRANIPTIALRYSIIQGPRQSPHNPYSGALRQFVRTLLLKKQPVIFEDGEQLRDYVNIHDVVRANLLALTDKRMDFEVFNVGGGKEISVNTLYRKVQAALNNDTEARRSGSFRPGDTRHIFSSIAKLKSLGWEPKRTVDQSIQEYSEWIKKV